MAQSLKLKRSSVVNNNSPKLPTAEQLVVGEIALNFAEGYETLSTKNSNNGIATFSSDSVLNKRYATSGAVVDAISALTVTLEEDELAINQSINRHNDRITALEEAGFISGYTETDPTVPAWAKAENKPTYTASEVGALPDTTDIPTQATILSSGFTKNAGTLTGVTINGAAASISNGVASANIPVLPTVTSSDNGKVLTVVNGQWSATTPLTVYTGNNAPDNSMGNNGDIYLQTS